MAFITLTDADITDAAFWAAQDINADSTIDASGVSDIFQIVITANSISFTDTTTGVVTNYTNADLFSGTFSNFVSFVGNDADNSASGATGLNASGYIGGSGDDTFTDDGSLGGQLSGGDGDDTLTGGVGSNQIFGGIGNDTMFGGAGGNNNLTGGEGNDILFAADGSGNLDGGIGDDQLFASENTTFVQGGTGTDVLNLPPNAVVSPFSPTGGTVSFVDPDGSPTGGTFTYINVENVTVACFVKGTRIRAQNGRDVAIEALVHGDLVKTMDHGMQPIKWMGHRTVSGQGDFAPIVFQKGAIGNSDTLRVSPQHRILLRDWRAELLFGEKEVLVAAKHLVNGDTIYAQACESVTYYHMMFDQHEIVLSEGAKTESFYVTEASIHGLDKDTRSELKALFPELIDEMRRPVMAGARTFLKRYEAALLST
ncbi:hypothetical protein F9L33_14010 [Amylibacter sp. SFDW26]|uniref:Hint domain-containing protein n=1 Tax=Amylibacter sp. SFDW26 TaxID=2652722 RepID=UPI00126225CC|nr:Hint domain-containing protein [Amylibacter sp. SFDW26]KAB7610412.1 hypothetical protein F9L33_14010 [Amylibacter sp. SFDW26]